MAIIENQNKTFICRIYDPAGTYKKAFTDRDFSSPLSFSISVNGGLSAMDLTTTMSLDEWVQPTGKLADLDLGDICKFEVFDKENPEGLQIYSGIFSGIQINLNSGKEEVALQFLPNTIRLAKTILRDTDNETTTKSFTDNDPADIFRYIIYHSGADITYNVSTVFDTGLARSYEFVGVNNLEALNRTINLTTNGWYYYIGGDDKAYLSNYESGTPDFTLFDTAIFDTDVWDYDTSVSFATVHNLYLNRHIKNIEVNKNMAELTNRILFVGGGTPQLYEQYSSTGSVGDYGAYEEYLSDESVTDSNSAENIANRYLSIRNLPKTTYLVEIIDSNFSENGYDIESFRVGDKVKITTQRNDDSYTIWGRFNWGQDYWYYKIRALFGITQFIKKINYNMFGCTLELQLEPDQIIERIENINSDFQQYRIQNIPDIPSNI